MMFNPPKIVYSHCGKDERIFVAQYQDNGLSYSKGLQITNPVILINLDKFEHGISFAYTLFHEIFHYLVRPIPIWLERAFDITWDLSTGFHDKEEVHNYKLLFVLEDPCQCASCASCTS